MSAYTIYLYIYLYIYIGYEYIYTVLYIILNRTHCCCLSVYYYNGLPRRNPQKMTINIVVYLR